MKLKQLLGGLVGILLAATVLTMVDSPKKALADTQVGYVGKLLPTTGDFLSGNSVNVPLNSSTNTLLGANSSVITIQPGCGLAIWPLFVLTNANAASMASNITITLASSPWTNSSNPEVAATPVGTTQFTTITTGLTYAPTGNGTNVVMGYAWFPWTNIAGAKVTVTSIATTFTNVGGVFLSNIFWKQFAPQ